MSIFGDPTKLVQIPRMRRATALSDEAPAVRAGSGRWLCAFSQAGFWALGSRRGELGETGYVGVSLWEGLVGMCLKGQPINLEPNLKSVAEEDPVWGVIPSFFRTSFWELPGSFQRRWQ